MMLSSAVKPVFVATSARVQKPRAARQPLVCQSSKDFNAPALGLGALAAAQLMLSSPALALQRGIDSEAFGAPAQNKEATNLPSTFFKTGEALQEKLGANTDPQNLNKTNSGGGANAPNLSGNQADFQADKAVLEVGKAGKKAVDNITPDLSELPSPKELVSKGKSSAKANLPDPSGAANKAKSLGSDIGKKLPSANSLGNKAKSAIPKDIGSKNI